MMNRILALVLIMLFSTSSYAIDDVVTRQSNADKAMEMGDMDAAFEAYMALLEVLPGNDDALVITASMAAELGLTELAIELWVKRADLAINQGQKMKAAEANAEISNLFNIIPPSLEAKLAEASRFENEDQNEAYLMLEEMNQEAEAAIENQDAEGAVNARESALMVATDLFGERHWVTIASNQNMGLLYAQLGLLEEAETFYGMALAAAEESLGATHPNTLAINTSIAELYYAMGLTEESQLILEMVTAGLESSLGAGHQLTINARTAEIYVNRSARLYGVALEAQVGLCATIELAYGSYHPQSVGCLQKVAEDQKVLGEISDAEATYELIIARMSLSKPGVDAAVLNSLTQVAELYRIAGRYQESKDLLSSVIQTSLQIGEIEGSFVAKSYLGRVFNNEGEFNKAQIVTEEVLAYGEGNWQGEPIRVFNTLLELGAIYQYRGKLAQAEKAFDDALKGLVQVYGESHPSALVASNNLGQLYERGGLYDKAEPIIKNTLAQMESSLGVYHPDTLRVRNNLALLHESQGNFREAEPLYQKSVDMMATKFGHNHTDTIAVKNNLAYLYMVMEQFDKSAEIFQEVKEQWTVLFGAEHINTLKATNNLGRIFQKLGRLPEAEQEILIALAARQSTLGEKHIDSIRSMIDLGGVYLEQKRLPEAETQLIAALALAEGELGNLHPYTFEALNYLADTILATGKMQAAIELMEVGFKRRSQFFDTMLWTTGENAREGYVRLHRPEFNKYLALLANIDDEKSAKRAINASLQRKGLLLKVTSEIQQIATMTTDPELQGLATQLEEARKSLASMTLSGPTAETQGRHTQALYGLEQKVNELQGELGRASVRFRTSTAKINADRLETSIQEGAALIDFQMFEDKGERRFLASIVKNIDGEIEYNLVVYNDRDSIDATIIEYREMIQDDQADEDDLLETGMSAYEEIWEPLNEALDDIEYVYLIPDGGLNILPFNALIDDDEAYLIQSIDLHTLTSGRDLIPNDYPLAKGKYLILAGPDYDADKIVSAENMAAAQGKRSASLQVGIQGAGTGLRGLNFAPLPGAEQEGRVIIEQVVAGAGASDEFFGNDAQEQILSSMTVAPEILHIATHGFFLKADDTLRKRILKASRSIDVLVPPPGDNPLLRAGLAFAGINTNAQFLGNIETTNDGVLTALEVLDLKLSGTRLVVLSACETGLGEINDGEGVYGLRRSFQEAGVAEVISSLWEVSDAGTQALMTDFYNKMLAGTPAREALREVQVEMIDSPAWGYPYIWSAFMIVGSYESAGISTQ
ncbi:MAG: CHAT domain-containing protein/tetratricopeptide (TPR) repeat protein [Candidatus Azotimanducaceae bacterium]|jgi:CHAT domain-containing protein/tetratricopeptide (TPR) repeat protein